MKLLLWFWRICVVGIVVFAVGRLWLGAFRFPGIAALRSASGARNTESSAGGFSARPRARHFQEPIRRVKSWALVDAQRLEFGPARPKVGSRVWLLERLEEGEPCLWEGAQVASLSNRAVAFVGLRESHSRLKKYASSRDLPLTLKIVIQPSDLEGVELCGEWMPSKLQRGS